MRAELFARLSSRPGDVWRGQYQRWAKQILRIYGLEVRLVGTLPSLETERGALFLCPHRSPLDVAVLVSLLPTLRFLSRDDVKNWPVIGSAANRARTLFVERGDRKSAVRAVAQMREALEEGDALAVFPEGTTKATSELAPFRSGAFRACAGLDVDIWLVGIAYPEGFGWGRSGQSLMDHLREVALLAPIEVTLRFEKLTGLAANPAQAARLSRQKLQDLNRLLREEDAR